MRRFTPLLLILLTLPATVFGVERFPPPEFTTGYQQPHPTVPGARGEWFAALDVFVLLVALSLAAYLVLKKRSRRGAFVLMLCSLAYFGFYRHGCICPVGSIQNVAMTIWHHEYALPLLVGIFFAVPLVFALFFGRVFCAAVCPLGAAQDVVLLKPAKVPAWLAYPLELLPYLYLGAAVLFAATSSYFLICRFDPFVGFFRFSGDLGMLIFGAAILALATVIGRPYCRFLCPYGAVLRLLAPLAKWRVTITLDECIHCRLCEEACPYGAIKQPTTDTPKREQATGRRQLALLLVLLPLLLIFGGWLGGQSSGAFSRLDAQVRLADRIWLENHGQVAKTPKSLLAPLFGLHETEADQQQASDAFRNSDQSAETLFQQAAATRTRFRTGGWLFGGWIGLVIGVGLIGLSIRRQRTDYEADPATCLACGRCYQYCPREHAQRKQPRKGALN